MFFFVSFNTLLFLNFVMNKYFGGLSHSLSPELLDVIEILVSDCGLNFRFYPPL